MAPRVFAKLLQLADIGEGDRVLDVGAGTGYSAAVLGKIAKTVIALERDEKLAATARKNLAALGLGNVRVVEGPLADGWVDEGPYDAIVLEGSVSEPLAILLDQLKDGGRLVGVVGQTGLGKAVIWRRLGRSLDRWTAFDAAAPPLPGFETAPGLRSLNGCKDQNALPNQSISGADLLLNAPCTCVGLKPRWRRRFLANSIRAPTQTQLASPNVCGQPTIGVSRVVAERLLGRLVRRSNADRRPIYVSAAMGKLGVGVCVPGVAGSSVR